MKKYNECKVEKETMVVKYAQGEAKIAQHITSIDKLENRIREKDKEREAAAEKYELRVKEKEREKEVLAEKLRSLKSETSKSASERDTKVRNVPATCPHP